MNEKNKKRKYRRAYFVSFFLSSLFVFLLLEIFKNSWHKNPAAHIIWLFPLVFALSISFIDFYDNRKYISDFLIKCKNEFLKKNGNSEVETIKTYYNFSKYLGIYAFVGFQIIFFKHLLRDIINGLPITQFTILHWTLFGISMFALILLWRPPVPKEYQVERIIFYAILLFVIPFFIVALAKLELEILIVCGLFGGMLIWIDAYFIQSNFMLCDWLDWVNEYAREKHAKVELIMEQLNERKATEQTMIRTAVTLYSAACIGIFVRLIDFKHLQLKKNDFFLWGVILVTYVSLGWVKGLLFQARANRKKVRDNIRKIISNTVGEKTE